MNICVVTEGYPYADDPQFSFVEQLCIEMSRQNVNVYVISPQSIIHILLGKDKKHPLYRQERHGGTTIHIFRPYFLLAPHRFWRFNDFSFKYAVSRQFRKLKTKIDVCYGHFWNNAFYISEEAKKNNLPLFVASGEGNFDDLEKKYKSKKYQAFSKNVSGVFCVSSYCRDISVTYGLTTSDKCLVLPNSIDNNLFRPLNRLDLRNKYGINKDAFIIAFVGAFINRKGSDRVSQAIKLLAEDGVEVQSFFIGKGQGPENLLPDCDGVIHCGPVEHAKIPEYLNMADVFVLPSLNEGCSNAIIEALACGLPVISSDRSFNYDVLNDSNSIMINPLDISELSMAIRRLKNDKKFREALSQGALHSAQSLTISNRARRMIDKIKQFV